MIATFIIEIALLIFVLFKYSLRSARIRLVSLSLLFLAIFQLAEYNVCGGMGMHAADWSRLGFIAITTLPPLGLHLVLTIAGKTGDWKKLPLIAYINAFLWIVLFGFTNRAFDSYSCGGNYAIFSMRSPYDTFYLLYYGFWLLAAILLAVAFMREVGKGRCRALELMVIGYLLFILPTMIVMNVNRATIEGLPSIMCGFAIVYALILAFGVSRLDKQIAAEKIPKEKKAKKK